MFPFDHVTHGSRALAEKSSIDNLEVWCTCSSLLLQTTKHLDLRHYTPSIWPNYCLHLCLINLVKNISYVIKNINSKLGLTKLIKKILIGVFNPDIIVDFYHKYMVACVCIKSIIYLFIIISLEMQTTFYVRNGIFHKK